MTLLNLAISYLHILLVGQSTDWSKSIIPCLSVWLGLSVLSEVELQRMCDEMTSKFSRLSAELLTSLQTRDILAGEMEAKNRYSFIRDSYREGSKGIIKSELFFTTI